VEERPLVYTTSEIQQVLKVGRSTAQEIARQIGVRVSPRRLVVPKVALDRFLEKEGATHS
jgi:hypothetical protein